MFSTCAREFIPFYIEYLLGFFDLLARIVLARCFNASIRWNELQRQYYMAHVA